MRLLLMAIALLCLPPVGVVAAPVDMTVMFPDMEPFLMAGEQPGTATGPVADRIGQLARDAEIHITWTGPKPRSRILAEMAAGHPVCYPNIRLTPDRQAQYKFTDPLFLPPRWMVLARRQLEIGRYASLEALLADPSPIMGRLLGASMGAELDAMLMAASAASLPVRGSPSDLLTLLAAGRIDYMIVDADALDIVARRAGIEVASFDLVSFPDLPSPEPGRIMCARSVPDEIILRLNRALADRPPPRSE
ncbi:transporter substrate-binding domain-containing protein [Oleisolibacter albus]|uniref:transporter substrate-binding domain-containing protein n=1 Tax=Oleisolibacter albus TaxID=2171757 RepID=UPI0013901185|nr:transporter substrate-binding domain-containing protein [Oleisolibacter albus]